MSCNKCDEPKERCGCADSPLSIPTTYSGDPSVCPITTPCEETCSEVYDMKCVCYTGPDICELNVSTGDRLEEVIQKLILSVATISCLTPEQGPQGDQGDPGLDAEVNVIATNTLPPGSDAEVTDGNPDPRIADLTFNIPQGEDGDDGLNAEVNVIATNTIASGNPASVIDSNPDPRVADLTFNIPQGPEGPPGPGFNFDFDSPDTTLDLTTSNVVFTSAWVNPTYESGETKYGELLYWDISSSLCYVSLFMLVNVDRVNGTALTWNRRLSNPQTVIQINGLPFTPRVGTSVGTGTNYNLNIAAHFHGFLNDIDFPGVTGAYEEHEVIPFRGTGSNAIITSQMTTGYGYHAPAIKDFVMHLQFAGYVFKA